MTIRKGVVAGLLLAIGAMSMHAADASPRLLIRSDTAGPGSLDPTFGTAGRVVSKIDAGATDVQMQRDGKIDVAAGHFVVRYLPNGTLDAAFGRSGVMALSITTAGLRIQNDGKIVAIGTVRDTYGVPIHAAVARLNANGTHDITFGSAGRIVFDFVKGVSSVGSAGLIQPDGKILVGGVANAGPCNRNIFAGLARFDPNGKPDTSFGGSGFVSEQGLFRTFDSLGLQSDGRIVISGDFNTVAHFLPDGTRDTTTSGALVSTAHSGASSFEPDGRIVGGGYNYDNGEYDMQMMRFLQSGAADSSFKSPAIDFGATGATGYDVAYAVAVEPSGKILAGGISQVQGYASLFGLARFNPDGSLDASFAHGGRLTTAFSGAAQLTAITVQSDGKIVAAGSLADSSGTRTFLVLARYL